jgi:pyridinium-3,5-biscarboxylic acid mononucleotide sulfurtransferase
MEQKERQLFSALEQMGSVIVAYSGGADSAYLAWAANRVLGARATAITADSASLPESHKGDAEAFAREHGIRHEYIITRDSIIPTTSLTIPTAAFTARTSCSPGSTRWRASGASRT